MSTFQSKRVSKTYRQINDATPGQVFPLLCPVLEKEWIDNWEYEMVYSKSGVAEPGCIFNTPGPGNKSTTWYVTRHDTTQYIVEFVRVSPGEMVVKIFIQLLDNKNGTTTADILYEYTALSETANQWIIQEADAAFKKNMDYWEKAINHYLRTGTKLLKP